ncbi:glutamic-type intramembrane protease PrsW [Sporosarcina pasteurii]|uniref:Protease PrsW n=1 Tax=Sporosarcina pasteurii TaxID=1474 RepID=A0A380BJP0_SPOPA|nr:glutamic-type intramembrane protease PrsW [Sporosarcina pasteurii]MDS9470803.1 glutamic-type intramembrane protease PrsW [Sporosarcina pasteurii]QBQ05528.1 intramembrane metalloprotease PrsW [Sporosarcina pasteurii]SUJ02363.1 Protease prsW [Sporosarcina pasteurii]
MFILLTLAIAPGLALFSYFYLRKQIAKEPSRTLLHTFVYGAVMTFPILFIQHVFEEENIFSHVFFRNVVFTSGLEEFFKWLLLLLTIYRHVEFEDAYDGILYGASISLGFATVENILYLLTYGTDIAFMRALLPVSSHALFGVVMGYYIGKAKFDESNKTLLLFLALLAPYLLHFIYNGIFLVRKFSLYMMIPFMLFLWWFGLTRVKNAHIHAMHQFRSKANIE